MMQPLSLNDCLTTRHSIQRVCSAKLPLRLVNTHSGLQLEWAGIARVRLMESLPVCLNLEQAHRLLLGLQSSPWKAPPSYPKRRIWAEQAVDLPLAQMTLTDFQRAWFKAVRERYGKSTVSLLLRIRPRGATLLDLLRVRAHRMILSRRLSEAPVLAPLLAQDPGMWPSLDNWKLVKSRLMSMGLSAPAWRWLCHQSRAYVARFAWNELGHLAWVNLHSAVGRRIPVCWVDAQTGALRGFGGLQTWLRRNPEAFNTPQALNLLRALRLALERRNECPDRGLQREVEQEEFPLIADWLLANPVLARLGGQSITRDWTYDTLMARQSHWHLLERQIDSARVNVFWPEVLGMGELSDGVSYVELTSLNALLLEAKKMHHCVPSYIDRCMAGDVCLFHLHRKGGLAERATLELRRIGLGRWQVSQLKGPCNAAVGDALWAAARMLALKASRPGPYGLSMC
ncbi:PcfJ domain-containing protein [Limnobacter humi]|uniref:PcfJ domain-containing protein n=1 Tax=Limnobacter humi TaxID=1778671 RepID=A0ABT1WEX8_9BURK|nr:PcfJ domain-containing protein [Limnobacter humi]MCQ8896080.1 PcfJ domain-containing protein [Limnobacter humi]